MWISLQLPNMKQSSGLSSLYPKFIYQYGFTVCLFDLWFWLTMFLACQHQRDPGITSTLVGSSLNIEKVMLACLFVSQTLPPNHASEYTDIFLKLWSLISSKECVWNPIKTTWKPVEAFQVQLTNYFMALYIKTRWQHISSPFSCLASFVEGIHSAPI